MAEETEPVKDIFHRTLGSSPSFLIINLQDEVVRYEAAEKTGLWRVPDKLSILVKKIEYLGGRAILLQNVQEVRNGSDIPLVFVSTNIAHNELAFKTWLHMADQHGRCFDVFHENFVHDILEFGEVGLLEDYLIKPSMFKAGAYTGQQILSGSFKWRNFAFDKEDSDSSSSESEADRYVKYRHRDKSRVTPRQASPPLVSPVLTEPACTSTSVKLEVSSDRETTSETIDHFDFNDPTSLLSLSLNQQESDSVSTFEESDEDSHDRVPARATAKRTATGRSILDSPPTVRARRVSPIRDSPPASPPPPPPHGKNRGGAPPGPKLPKINPEDQERILNYIIDNNAFYRIKGRTLYQEMAQANILPGRTFETLSNHVKRILLRRDVFEQISRRMEMDPIARAKFERHLF